MKSTISILMVVLILIVGAGYIYFSRTNTVNQPLTANLSKSNNNSPEMTPSISPDSSVMNSEFSNYQDAKGVYAFSYPKDFTLDKQNNGAQVRVYKRGESQRAQSELSDGVILVFEDQVLNNKSLDEFVDENIKNLTADGTVEITNPKKEIKINDYNGYIYTAQGLGTYDSLVLQKDSLSDSALIITKVINDPKNLGYSSEVDSILKTLKLLK